MRTSNVVICYVIIFPFIYFFSHAATIYYHLVYGELYSIIVHVTLQQTIAKGIYKIIRMECGIIFEMKARMLESSERQVWKVFFYLE